MYRVNYLLFIAFLVCVVPASAQDKMISLTPSYNMPLGQLKWSYTSSPGIDLTFSMLDVGKRWTTGMGLGVGYLQFDPVADTLYYVVDQGGVGGLGLGKAVYSSFKTLKVSASVMASRMLTPKLDATVGLEVGAYYGKRVIEFTDQFGGQDGLDELTTRVALVPRVGLTYFLGEHWSVAPFLSYTLMLEAGDTNPNAMNYNPDTGKLLRYYSTGVALNFLF